MQLIIKQIFNNNTAIVDLDDINKQLLKVRGLPFINPKGRRWTARRLKKSFTLILRILKRISTFC